MAQNQTRASRTRSNYPGDVKDESFTGLRPTTGKRSGEDLTEEIDDLLAEVDSVLETNAEEFVRNYVQKGGQ